MEHTAIYLMTPMAFGVIAAAAWSASGASAPKWLLALLPHRDAARDHAVRSVSLPTHRFSMTLF